MAWGKDRVIDFQNMHFVLYPVDHCDKSQQNQLEELSFSAKFSFPNKHQIASL